MGVAVLVIGRSGSGKSRSMKFFNENELGVIKAIEKELPFRNKFGSITTDNYAKIKQLLLKSKANSLVIDDSGYLLTNEFMRRTFEKGFDKYNEMGFNYFDLITFVKTQLPQNKIVYFIMHEDESEITGVVKPKTLGKLLDEKVCVEGMFTIVLRCVENNGEHNFITNGSGAKSPEEMFTDVKIDNNLKLVDDAIREYWGLNNENNGTDSTTEA